MKKIAIIGNIRKPKAKEVIEDIVKCLKKRGISVGSTPELKEFLGIDMESLTETEIPGFGEMIIALGGDGTMLRAARLVGSSGIPIFGINLGSLGFLTDVSLDELHPMIENVMDGRYEIEKRMIIESMIEKSGEYFFALNDIVIRAPTRVVELVIEVDNQFVSKFIADGLIVSTPTGSTAYSLACGGPILNPTMETIILTPICPHTLAIRPMIISASQVCSVTVNFKIEQPFLTSDGQVSRSLESGDIIVFKRASFWMNLVRATRKSFYEILRTKLGWVGK